MIGLIVFLSLFFPPKSRDVFLDDELRDARFKGFVKVEDYRGTTIFFEPADKQGQQLMASTRAIEPRIMDKVKYPDKPRTGVWPSIGDSVLIVIDKDNRVSLFAYVENGDYRFWNPFNEFSGTTFVFSPPARRLKGKQYETGADGTCMEGCLLRRDLINVYDNK